MEKSRCSWARGSEQMLRYHDEEWGVPVTDDRKLFEFLLLESAQAGLSWAAILARREGYRACFAGFDPARVAAFNEADVRRLMADGRIIRNRLKIESAVNNARIFLELSARHGSFAAWLWRYVDGSPLQHGFTSPEAVPAKSGLSDQLARDMKALGFKFLGSTILYSYLQAMGLVNDHLTSCFRHEEVKALAAGIHWGEGAAG